MQVLSPKWPISANENFFQKTCWWALFLSFMLSTFQKSTSDINLLVKSIKEYWNLLVQEPFLAITWQPDFSQTCSFGRMLINHKNFYFTQILDKTNDTIFLKSPKTMFFGHFWPTGIFSQKSSCHTQLYMGPNTIVISEKTNRPIPRKPMESMRDGLKDGWTDRPYFIGPYWPRLGVQLTVAWLNFNHA